MLQQASHALEIRVPKPGLFDITTAISGWIDSERLGAGLLTIFCAHTSASLLIQENAAAPARHDLEDFFERIAPENPALYTHNDEGSDDMPAHIRTALTDSQLSIPVQHGKLTLGTWQGIFLFEHRRDAPARRIILQFIGESR